jgi:adenylate cyclase
LKHQSKSSSARNIPILIAASVIALVCLVQALPRFLPGFEVFQRLEWMTYDWRLKLAASQSGHSGSPRFGGVFIDDTALQKMNEGLPGFRVSWPWPRAFHGRVVRELKAQGADCVGFDILFDQLQPADSRFDVPDRDQGKMTSDQFFADQLRQAGNVVLAAESGNQLFPAEFFRTNALALGNISSRADPDGILRRVKAFGDHRVWHPAIRYVGRGLGLDLSRPRFDPGGIWFPIRGGGRHRIPLNPDGSLKIEEIIPGEAVGSPQMPYTMERVWQLGIVLGARRLNLDLAHPVFQPGRILLRGPQGVERYIPVDGDGNFYIDWTMKWNDPHLTAENILKLIALDEAREGGTDVISRFKDKLVVVGSIGTGNNISDRGATPLERETLLISKHWNIANSILTGHFIRKSTYATELFLILFMGVTSALLTWKFRALLSSLLVVLVMTCYAGLAVFLFTGYRYWLPLILPAGAALCMTHVSMITYRVRVEQRERRRIRSVFSRVVSPSVVNELLTAEQLSLGGARRQVTIYFADIRGFTRMTDEIQAEAEDFIRRHGLPPAAADAYRDAQAGDLLATVSLYLGVISDTVKKHNGTVDKYIGDCVLAFWGAPIPDDRHASACVRAAIEAQRALHQLNRRRAAENERREKKNAARVSSGDPALPLLRLLELGSGINTGTATVGLMGSQDSLSYTVLGQEVNLASRLEGVSGRGRIIISDATYREIQRLDPDLAATCTELPPQDVKGFRETVKIYEVRWRDGDAEIRPEGGGGSTEARPSADATVKR